MPCLTPDQWLSLLRDADGMKDLALPDWFDVPLGVVVLAPERSHDSAETCQPDRAPTPRHLRGARLPARRTTPIDAGARRRTIGRMADPTWEPVVLPLLERVRIAEQEGRDLPAEQLVEGLPVTAQAVQAELRRLLAAGFIAGELEEETGNAIFLELSDPMLLERGARAVGTWPADDPYDALLALLDERIRDAPDEDTRSRLRRLREVLGDVGKGAAGGLLGAFLRQMIGLP